jgi:hypothetical protein
MACTTTNKSAGVSGCSVRSARRRRAPDAAPVPFWDAIAAAACAARMQRSASTAAGDSGSSVASDVRVRLSTAASSMRFCTRAWRATASALANRSACAVDRSFIVGLPTSAKDCAAEGDRRCALLRPRRSDAWLRNSAVFTSETGGLATVDVSIERATHDVTGLKLDRDCPRTRKQQKVSGVGF